MRLRKTKIIIMTVLFSLSMVIGGVSSFFEVQAAQIINLARTEGVVVTSDCSDGALTPDKAIDGDAVDKKSRWSSKNVWSTQNPSDTGHTTTHGHWLQIAFPKEVNIHSVNIIWELLNAEIYAIEASDDGEHWVTIENFNHTPKNAVQTIEFEQTISLSYIRLRTEKMDISDATNPLHPYYQNVSIYEMEVFGEAPASKEINLSLVKGVIATSDCHTGTYAPGLAIDGEESFKSKWSSENIRDTDNPADFNHESAHGHWLQLAFPEVVQANSVVIKWEKPNAEIYALESSMDGKDWQTMKNFAQSPGPLPEGIDTVSATEVPVTQEINFDHAVSLKYIRLRTEKITTDGTLNIYNPYHQNVVIREFQVRGDDPDYAINSIAAQIETPIIIYHTDGSRKLSVPKVPEGYQIELIGADYEQVIGDDGRIYPTIEEKEVTVGYKISKGKRTVESPALVLNIPAAQTSQIKDANAKPTVIPELAEWRGSKGAFTITKESRIILGSKKLSQTALEFSKDYEALVGNKLPIITGTSANVKPGDFYLDMSSNTGLGDEGSYCQITDSISLTGETAKGVYWGTRSILQILKQTKNEIPQGEIRDYPKYKVRGFGIDVGRQTVSLDMLNEYAKTMSWYKMNDLHIHLNDNEILGYSGKTDSIENALTAYSGFRLESSITGKNGVPLTSKDMYYTKEGFRNFIQNARNIGINVVPEIDSPAHALAFTKIFPEYAFKTDPTHVDQIDLSVPGAVDLMKRVYTEYLEGENPVFDKDTTVHIGMDEYFGNSDTYRQYGNTLIDLLGGRTVRLWGSLSNIKSTIKIKSENVQMNIWHTMWANPKDMYDLGYGLINSQNGTLYIIPGGGWDYLNSEKIYNEWTPNIFVDSLNSSKTYEIPAYSKQMLGGSYTMWHDLTGNIDYGLTEYDDFVRFLEPISIISEKLWAEGKDKSYEDVTKLKDIVDISPNGNPYHKVASKTATTLQYDFETAACKDTSGNDYHAVKNTATLVDGKRGKAFDLSKNAIVSMPLHKIGPTYTVSFWVKRNEMANDNEQILFETVKPYGKEDSKEKFHSYQFKAVQKDTGKVGFSREDYDYSFDYTLPKGEWVYVSVAGKQDITNLYVNGELVSTLGTHETWSPYATFPFPLGQIGSATKGFEGMLDKLTVTDGTLPMIADKTELDQKVKEAKDIQATLYTKDSYSKLQNSVKHAEEFLNSNEVDILKIELDAEITALTETIATLEIHAADLENYQKQLVLKDAGLYTSGSYEIYLKAYQNLMDLEVGNTTIETFHTLKEAFALAEQNLVEISTIEPSEPIKPVPPLDAITTVDTPDTGDTHAIAPYLIMLLVTSIPMVIFYKKNEQMHNSIDT